jgi:Zn-dependent peptidase ImmA (M78 family)/transcriptional regulator with XRE-family HTH domain
MMQEIHPGMITIAREARGMTQQELATVLRVHKTQLSRMESGELPIGKEVLESLSQACGFPTLFFSHDPGSRNIALRYRRRQKVPSRVLSSLEARCFIICRHIDYLSGALQWQPGALPSIASSHASPVDMAVALRQLWQLPDAPLLSIAGLLESRGILISRFDFGTERVDSRSMHTPLGLPVIFVNSQLSGDRQRFSLAYELGQLLLPGEAAGEKEVNRFAAEWLMPAKAMVPFFAEGVTLQRLMEGKRQWRVSMISLLYRADDLGLITPNQKRYLLQQFNQLRIRRIEPPELEVDPEACTRLRGLVYQYLQQYDLGLLECCQHLCITPADLLHYYG